MQATTTAQPTLCKRAGCNRPVFHVAGHRKRAYCSDACRQQDYRNRKGLVNEKVALASIQQLIAQLEERVQQLEDELAVKEEQVRNLQARLKFEECLQADTQVRYFKAWLKRRSHPQDSTFAKRFLADTRLPQHASRALYEARLQACGYYAEDISLFRDLWLTMMLEQS